MTALLVLVGLVLAVAICAGAMKLPGIILKVISVVFACVIFVIFLALGSIRLIGENEVGVVVKNWGSNLPAGRIIAVNGEKGPQAEILGPGWHFWYWPGLYDVEKVPVIEIKPNQVGLVTTTDGDPLPRGEIYAPEWERETFSNMLKAEHFLAQGGGYKGPQASVLTPGKYRVNTKLYKIEMVSVTNVPPANVAVIKSNVGSIPPGGMDAVRLVAQDQRGIRKVPFTEGEYYLNTRAYEVTLISTKENIIEFTEEDSASELNRSIKVRTSDGFEFPVDVRIVYTIEPTNAPLVVSTLRDDREGLMRVLQGSVRSIFRNQAQDVKALDYVQQRVQQEQRSTQMLAEEMEQYGISISAVRIADLGDESERWQSLLRTQTDREIALQEQETFKEQQRAAEEKKALSRTEQEAEEERRLATAKYEVQIAEQNKEQRIIEANAEAEAIRIKAEAQAGAYKVIAEQIGQGNAALVELLKIVGERGINITPRVMVVGGNGAGAADAKDAETTALIGTMLDSMLAREDAQTSRAD